jgi:signal transduction histidine kinase
MVTGSTIDPADVAASRTPRAIAWAAWSVSLALAAGTTVLVVLNHSILNAGSYTVIIVIILVALVYTTVGGLIGSRLPRNPIAWLLSAIGVALAYAAFVEQYGLRGLVTAPASLPAVHPIVSIGNATPIFAVASLLVVVLLFPDGRPPSPRWRPVLWVAVAVDAVGTVGFLLQKARVTGLANALGDQGVAFHNSLGVFGTHGPASVVLGVTGALGLGSALAAIVGLFLRRRRGSPELRQQLAWLGYVAVVAVVAFVLAAILGNGNGLVPNILWGVLFGDIVLGIPLACGIAVLRYRLYELDIVIRKTVVFGALVALFTAVYAAVVIGVGAIIGHRENAVLTFAGAAIAAILFQPVRSRVRRVADRLVYGQRATPYELLSSLAQRVGGTYSIDDVLPWMVQVLGQGTGARRAEVWLHVGSEYRLAAGWPRGEDDPPPREVLPALADELPALAGMDGVFPVRHQDELLGALAVAMPPNEPLAGSKEKLIQDLAAQAGLVLRNVLLIEELRASRVRLVAAQDEERRRLERNIHDGAQQQLVALSVKMRVLQTVLRRDADQAENLLHQAEQDLGEAVETLRELARGIYPPLLADLGLAEALRAQARKAALPVDVDSDGIGRYPQNQEAAVYFCCLEALQNVAKYARATRAVVTLSEEDGELRFTVRDDGRGFDTTRAATGTGVQGMADRLEALGGTLQVRSMPGAGTTVIGRLPSGRI